MTFNNHLFLVISLSFLLVSFSFPAQAHRTLLIDSSSSSDDVADSPASASPSTLSTLSNVIVSSISFAPFASPSPAPSPAGASSQEQDEDINEEYEEALLDYLGNNVEVEFQNTITGHVQNIANEIKEKTLGFIHETIEKRLADGGNNEIEKKCINVCKSDYEDLINDVTEVLHDFIMTHNYEMISDYLHGLNYDVQSCRKCRAEISLDYDSEFNEFDEWLTAMGTLSAAELNKTIHA